MSEWGDPEDDESGPLWCPIAIVIVVAALLIIVVFLGN